MENDHQYVKPLYQDSQLVLTQKKKISDMRKAEKEIIIKNQFKMTCLLSMLSKSKTPLGRKMEIHFKIAIFVFGV